MELASLYSLSKTLLRLITKTPETDLLLPSFLVAFVVWGGLFFLQGLGIFLLAKRRGISGGIIAFVPILNMFYLGAILGEIRLAGYKISNWGLFVMFAQALSVLLNLLMLATEFYLFGVQGAVTVWDFEGGVVGYQFPDMNTFWGKAAVWIYEYGNFFLSMADVIYQIIIFIFLFFLLKKWSVSRYVVWSIILLFVPITRYVILFLACVRESRMPARE